MHKSAIYITALLLLTTISALALVYSKYQTRKLSMQLTQLRLDREELNMEWGRLRLEHGSLANHSKIENAAVSRLQMQYPKDVQVMVQR